MGPMQTVPLTLQSSVVVRATPEEVYALVSDVTRTGEWSPVCAQCWWDEGQGPEAGAYFTGRNVTPDRTWETRSEVVVADPGREFAWSVGPGVVRWAYLITSTDDGTELTETWEFGEGGREFFDKRFGSEAQREIAEREQAAREGIPTTLAAIKRILEG
ncbi:SRPBCC family protein [Rhodococcus artemisiae]